MSKHTPEPCSLETHELIEEGFYSGMFPESDCHELSPEDFERACKCVNSCAGMEDPQAEIKRLKEEKDKLLKAATIMRDYFKHKPKMQFTHRALCALINEIGGSNG